MIVVDRYGTEAASGTISMMLGASPVKPAYMSLKIDRPFLFAIADQPTGAILYVGRVTDPRETTVDLPAPEIPDPHEPKWPWSF